MATHGNKSGEVLKIPVLRPLPRPIKLHPGGGVSGELGKVFKLALEEIKACIYVQKFILNFTEGKDVGPTPFK